MTFLIFLKSFTSQWQIPLAVDTFQHRENLLPNGWSNVGSTNLRDIGPLEARKFVRVVKLDILRVYDRS
jgi:hypothetical protein